MKVSGQEICSYCGAHFATHPAIVDLGQNAGLSNLPDIPPRVRCPNCNVVFRSVGYRYFGFVSPRALRSGIVIFLFGMALYALWPLLWQAHP